MISLIGALIIIFFLFCLNLCAIGRIRKLEILNTNYVEKLNRLEELKSIDEDELDELAENHVEGFNYTAKPLPNERALAKASFKSGYRKAKEDKV